MKLKTKVEILKNGTVSKTLPEVTSDITISIGRSESCHIKIPDKKISRLHANLIFKDDAIFITDENSFNKTWINDIQLVPHVSHHIVEDALINLGDSDHCLKITFTGEPKNKLSTPPVNPKSQISEILDKKGQIVIGRDASCDIVLTSVMVSRKHAIIQKKSDGVYIRDMDSTNGVYINGKRIDQETLIGDQDQILIGPSNFHLKAGEQKIPHSIIADNIEKKYPDGHIGLQTMSIKIPSNEFVALMGPSGCGKSTLLKGLNGANPVTSGAVYIQGLKLNQENFKILKQNIGYVPQDDIIHKELTLSQTMYYAAKLRIAADVTDKEISKKIEEVLENLNIAIPELRNKKIADLSGGQRKRVCIAVELLSDPTILFLDEPTSPLDPETIEDFLNCIKNLTKDGKTVIMVTHKPSDLKYVSKVIFLSAGGYHAYFGNQNGLLNHFKKKDLIEVYAELKTEKKGKLANDKWKNSSNNSEIVLVAEELTVPKTTTPLSQLYWLTRRYLNIKLNDRSNLFILLIQPIIIATMMGLIFNYFENSVLFLMAISGIWFGVSNAAKEIVGEKPIYERERMYNLNILNYIFSKLLVLSLIAFVQSIIFVGIIYVFYHSPDDGLEQFKGLLSSIFFMFYISFSATLFGLLISTYFKNTEAVMSIIPIALIPQILLAGVIAKIDGTWKCIFSYLMIGRWGTEGFCHIQDNLAVDTDGVKDSLGVNIINLAKFSRPEGAIIDSTAMKDMIPGNAVEDLSVYTEIDVKDWGLDFLMDPNWSDSLQANMLSIFFLSILFFMGVFTLLKRKDKQF